jgi:hypothetical protein
MIDLLSYLQGSMVENAKESDSKTKSAANLPFLEL